jgi:copper homeostasis protein
MAVMECDIVLAKELGADAIVLGVLRPDGTVDTDRTRRLIEQARPLPVTFHRAIDMARDPFEALEEALELGVERILTSGQEKSAIEGAEVIAEMVRRAGDRTIIMPGGGLTERNIAKVVRVTGAREIHGSASAVRDSRMIYRNGRVFMGGQVGPPEFAARVTSGERVRAFRAAAESVDGAGAAEAARAASG